MQWAAETRVRRVARPGLLDNTTLIPKTHQLIDSRPAVDAMDRTIAGMDDDFCLAVTIQIRDGW